jgi:hypothetical protein
MKNTSIFHNFMINIISGKKAVFASYFVLFGLLLTASPISAHAEFLDYIDPFGLFHNTNKGPLDYALDVIDPFSLVHGQDDTVVYQTQVQTQQVSAPLDASCYANPTSAYTGQTIYWNVSAFGSNGNYTYSWSGTDGLSGNSNTVAKIYSTSGAKTASVTVSSAGQTITRVCSSAVSIIDQVNPNPNPVTPPVYVYPPQYPAYPQYPTYNYGPTGSALDVSCYVNPTSASTGQTIYWNASSFGGNGNYSYFWTGTDGLGGQSSNVTKTYYSPGDKFASVTVTSAGQTITRQCSNSTTIYGGSGYSNNYPYNNNNYNNNYNNYPVNNQNYYQTDTSLEVSCTPNTAVAGTNQLVTWTSHVYGGNGNYQYYWTGTENLGGTQRTSAKSYSTAGTKSGALSVTSGGQTVTRQCTSVISVTDQGGGSNTVISQNSGGLRASCYANLDNITSGQAVTWSALSAGGNGSYNYSWSGSDSLSGTGPSVAKAYNGTGAKYASVTVTSGGESVTSTCVNTLAVGNNAGTITKTNTTVAKTATTTKDTSLLGAAFFGIGNFPLILFLILLILILIGLIIYLLYYRDREKDYGHTVVVTKKDETEEKHTVTVDNGNGNNQNGNGFHHNGNGHNH